MLGTSALSMWCGVVCGGKEWSDELCTDICRLSALLEDGICKSNRYLSLMKADFTFINKACKSTYLKCRRRQDVIMRSIAHEFISGRLVSPISPFCRCWLWNYEERTVPMLYAQRVRQR